MLKADDAGTAASGRNGNHFPGGVAPGDKRIPEQDENVPLGFAKRLLGLQHGMAEPLLLELIDERDRRIALEILADEFLASRNDHDDLVRPRALRLVDDELQGRLRANRQHFLRDDPSHRQESRAVSCRRYDRFHLAVIIPNFFRSLVRYS